MSKQMKNHKNLAYLLTAVIYVTVVAVAVAYSWTLQIHRFDLGLTVSRYVALHRWTATLYFFGAAVICVLLSLCVKRAKTRLIQKAVYWLTLVCVFGCAWFPCNRGRSRLTSDIHDIISYALVISVAMSFVLMAVFARHWRQRIYGLCSALFAAGFIAAFVCRMKGFHDTIFIWENVVIALFFFEIYLEEAAPAPQAKSGTPKISPVGE